MGDKLESMSLQELWQLFPIVLTEHRDCWAVWYKQQKDRLLPLLPGGSFVRVSHIGSTSVPGIWAKPIVDILLEVTKDTRLDDVMQRMIAAGWRCMSREEERISLNFGYTEDGFDEKVYHLHVRRAGDNDELYFRDYLIEHPTVAKEYEQLKRGLWKRYEHDRDGYTQAKTEFIAHYTALAKEQYKGRYQ